MARKLKCAYGAINMLKRNPRMMSDNAYMKLRDSLDRDPYMLEARGIVLWQVPTKLTVLDTSGKSPFEGQEGQLVCIGGNQRCKVLLEQGYDEIPESWVRLAKKPDGEWWDEDAAERFILLDNNPEGIAGENDYDRMINDFNERMMAAAGIDFSNFPEGLQKDMTDAAGGIGGEGDEEGGGVENEVETGEHGEKDPALEEWIQKRENVRRDLPELMETGFYLCAVFETHGQKMEFLEKAGIADKVEYEMFTDGIEFAKHVCGIEIERSGLHFPDMRVDKRLAEMAEENDQEPDDGEVDSEEVVKGLQADKAMFAECLDWVRGAEEGEVKGKPPAEIANRLLVYREWAEENLRRTDELLAVAEEDAKEEAERKVIEDRASDALRKAEAEREELGMVRRAKRYEFDPDEEGEDGEVDEEESSETDDGSDGVAEETEETEADEDDAVGDQE